MAQPAEFEDAMLDEVEQPDAEAQDYDESTILDVVSVLSDQEAHALFDVRARELMGMSGVEFLRRYDAGEFDALIDTPEYPWLTHLEMLIPLGR